MKLNIILAGIVLISFGCATGPSDYNDDQNNNDSELFNEVEGSSRSKQKRGSSPKSEESQIDAPKASSSDLEKRFENAVNSQRESDLLTAGSELLARSPDNPKVLAGFGIYYLKNNEPDAAKIFFDRVLAKDPQNADANNGLGIIAMKEGKEFEGQVFFKKALLGDRNHAGANANLGAYYLKYLDYDKALSLLERAYDEDRKNQTIANNYAIALRGTGKVDKALSIYKGMDSRNQSIPVLLNQAILLAEFKKDSKAAKEILNKIRFITTDPGILRKVNTLTQKLDQ